MTSDNSLDSGYYENERPEVSLLVDNSMLTILDVGCGMGNLGASLKRDRPQRKVFGIEFVEQAADVAKTKLDDVLVGDVQHMTIEFEPASFDCMIFADVLEHLVDPGMALRRLKPFLKPTGAIICSIPNMRHYTVFIKLARNGWLYEDYGHFDRTHLRFFSLSSMKRLVTDEGFRIESVVPRVVASNKMKIVNSLCLGRLEEFVAFQYLIKARNS